MSLTAGKARIAIHLFTRCDGCQQALIRETATLLRLGRVADLVLPAAPDDAQPADIALIIGPMRSDGDIGRLRRIRGQSRWLLTVGACSNQPGQNALRRGRSLASWRSQVYASDETINTLTDATAATSLVQVDGELPGCRVSGAQLFEVLRELLSGVTPPPVTESVCAECRREQAPCVMVQSGLPCLGPVTRAGCAARCPTAGRACQGCFGMAADSHSGALLPALLQLGLSRHEAEERLACALGLPPHSH